MDPAADFPALKAATGNFRRGLPRSFARYLTGEDWRVLYLRSEGPADPLLRLRVRTSDGADWCLADPVELLGDDEDLPPAERARRERLREGGAGITSFATDEQVSRAVFALSGRLMTVPVAPDARPVTLPAGEGVVDPRLSPDGRAIAYHRDGGLHVLCPDGSGFSIAEDGATWGLAEFIAAEEMGRYRGHWWAPDGDRLLVTRVAEDDVERWWLSDPTRPEAPPRAIRYPAAGTANADVRLFSVDMRGERTEIVWDRADFPYLARVSWSRAGALISVQSRDQRRIRHLSVLPDAGETRLLAEQVGGPWQELVAGSPRLGPAGQLVTAQVDPATDSWRLAVDGRWLSPRQWYVRSLHGCDSEGVWASATVHPTQNHLVLFRWDGSVEQVSRGLGWHTPLVTGRLPVVASADRDRWQPVVTVGSPESPVATIPNLAAAPPGTPRVDLVVDNGPVRVAAILPPGEDLAPVIVSSYGGPHAQRVVDSALPYASEQWLADQGFAVVIIDGRGTPGVAPSVEQAVAGNLAEHPLADQVSGLHRAAKHFPRRLDLTRVGIRGWSFGGYLAALAVLAEPDLFRAAFAGAPVTDWRLYDTHYTERYLGDPVANPRAYTRSSLLPRAADLRRPLLLAHGLADDNVVAAHTLQLSAALTAAGRPHQVLPLPGVSHMTPQEAITENLLRLELEFFRTHLGEPEED